MPAPIAAIKIPWRHCATSLACATVALLAGASQVGAQPQVSVPRELVLAMMHDLNNDALGRSIVVAQLPDGFPENLLPPNRHTILGSASNARRYDVSYVITRDDAAAALDTIRRRALATGWTLAPPTAEERGFAGATRALAPSWYCNAGQALLVAARTRDQGGSIIAATRYMNSSSTRCQAGPTAARPPEATRTSPLPSLQPPAEVQHEEVLAGSFGQDWIATARVRTTIGNGELLDNYARQLLEAGWVAGDSAQAGQLAVRHFSRVDALNATWHATLTVTTIAVAGIRLLRIHASPVR